MIDGCPIPCVCPEHLRAQIELRDAFLAVEKAVRDQTRVVMRAMEQDRCGRSLARVPVATGPPPIVRLAAEIVGEVIGSPGVKKSILEILNDGKRAGRRGRRR